MNSKELSWKSGDEVGGSLSPKPTGPKNLLQSFFFVVIVSARLFPHFEPKKRFLKKVRCIIAFG